MSSGAFNALGVTPLSPGAVLFAKFWVDFYIILWDGVI